MATGRFTLDPGIRALLHDLGVSTDRVPELEQGPVMLTVDEYYRFWDAIDREAGDPDFPVRIGRALSVESFNPPFFAALCSADLRRAAERIAAFKPLIGPIVLDVTGPDLTLSLRWPDGPAPSSLLVAAELAFWIALARIGTRRIVHATRVTMRSAHNSPALTEYFGTPVVAGPADSISFSAGDAAHPFLTEDESRWRLFEPELRRRLAALEASDTTADRVRAALHLNLPAGDSSIGGVATRLFVSPRSLQRRLQTEGTNYQAVLTTTREQLARRYLADRSLSTAQIAYLLAYDDTNSFYRAFRSWTGATPDELRPAGSRTRK
ncbi:AraC family transcriptional regulator [Actinoplanes bogorensis]|uniref:AraC family transcriptional regulator n=1 Tax=Paractinoplanes bogorensis TaxID=1610840 RepID=A0ABS5YQI3_9ACTN|nr:AraC family transcriptional regulator [Actinoplanes bogorensis]MBU2665331.1 AraC family transcriptional regulator [Actinoplanes bogorensis]